MASVPLEKRQVTCDSSKNPVPALHQMWAKESRFVHYIPPPSDMTDQALVGEWLERLDYICTDLHWLLQLPYHKFWSQVIFDVSLHHMLDSFLQYSPRPFDIDFKLLIDDKRKLHDEVTKLVFFTYLRMSTHKESKDNWMTSEVYREVIYENFLFDISKVLDLCTLYGHSNTAMLCKMVTNIFQRQPRYLDDLNEAIPTILQVFISILDKCGVEQDAGNLTPQKLCNENEKSLKFVSMKNEELQDIILYLADTAVTISSFLLVYPPACHVLHNHQFCPRMAHMYEKLIPFLEDAVKHRPFDSTCQKKMLHRKLSEARLHLLTVFHMVLSHISLQPVLDSISHKDKDSISDLGSFAADKYLEYFLTMLSSVLCEKRFLADYEGQFCFQDDMDIFLQASGELDETHYRFVLEAINSAYATHGKRKTPKGNTNRGGRTSPDGSSCPLAQSAQSFGSSCPLSQSAQSFGHTTSNTPSFEQLSKDAVAPVEKGVELESLICAVKDLLPHLENAFIQQALEEFNYDVELVVGALLEEKLPSSLQTVDTHTDRSYIPETSEDDFLVVNSRRNIYDNDQFDIFNNPDVDIKCIHKGKRAQIDTSLENKESIQELHALYDAYGSMDVSSMYEVQLYEDEYDDTYDVNDAGAKDADSADELTQHRPFTTPRVLQKKVNKFHETDTSEESEEDSETAKDVFVQDPAKLRELKEQQRMAHNLSQPKKTFDVKGKMKGQGQTREVVQSRKNKDRNKASKANHNRRLLADRKQHQGMF